MAEAQDNELVERLEQENHLLRWRYDVVAYHADLHAHAAQKAIRERDEARSEIERLTKQLEAAQTHRWRRAPAPVRETSPSPTSHSPAGIPVIVISRDRLACLQDLITWLEAAPGISEIHIVDNASTWPPLLEYLDGSAHTVHRLGVNLGHHAPWIIGLISEVSQGHFVVTDPDVLPDPNCPVDAIPHLRAILDRHPAIDKVGLGLRIDDLPAAFARRDAVIDWESKYWDNEVEPGVFRADVDTTFAVYRPGRDHKSFNALRTGAPYVARHVSWYADSASPTAEDVYYAHHADPAIASWTGNELSLLYRKDPPR